MIHRVLRLRNWVVDFLFAVKEYDIEGVLSCLYDAGAPKNILNRAEDLMSECEYNCGFTYSNPRKKRSVVFIGPTTSGEEFLNTFVHELRHLADSIADSLGVELDSEPPAYLSGDTAMELADVVCRLGCKK